MNPILPTTTTSSKYWPGGIHLYGDPSSDYEEWFNSVAIMLNTVHALCNQQVLTYNTLSIISPSKVRMLRARVVSNGKDPTS